MQTLDEMRSRHLLSPDQHAQIADWIIEHRTPEGILQMPPHLWKALALASVLMDLDADLTQPPLLGIGSGSDSSSGSGIDSGSDPGG